MSDAETFSPYLSKQEEKHIHPTDKHTVMEYKWNMEEIFRAAMDIMLPRECIVCGGRLLLREKFMCVHCAGDFPYTYFWQDRHNPMADRFNARIQEYIEELPTKEYSCAIALFHFRHDNNYRHITYRLKYHGDIASGRYFAEMLARRIKECTFLREIDTVIPVPLHITRKLKRGYNQAEIIARTIANEINAELRTDVVRRCRRTRTQTKLSVEEKAVNLRGAFSINPRYKPFHPGHILLVDDVFTTGSTLYECYRPLRRAFPAARISIATLAFV